MPKDKKPETIPAPPEQEEAVKDVAEYVKDVKKRLELARLVDKHGEISLKMAPLAKEKKDLTAAIKKMVGTYKIGKAMCGAWRINYYATWRKKVDTEKLKLYLLGKGVSIDIIMGALAIATTEKPAYNLKVTVPGVGGEEEEGEDAAA